MSPRAYHIHCSHYSLDGVLLSGDVVINYKDSDGDMIRIADQEDLDIACNNRGAGAVVFHLTDPGDYSVY